MRRRAQEAVEAIDAVLRAGPAVEHASIQAATNAVIALRDRVIDQYRSGTPGRDTLDRANALVSLAYGAEFPLSGLHLRRLEEARNGPAACSTVQAAEGPKRLQDSLVNIRPILWT
jgi:hypothetical protein